MEKASKGYKKTNNSKREIIDNAKLTKRIGKFTIIGIILALFNFIIYTFLARVIFNSNELLWLDTIISYALATVLAYILHSKITWKERLVTKRSIIMFFVWNGLTAFIISPLLTWLFGFITPLYQFAFNISQGIHLPFDYNFIESTGIFCLTTAVTMILNYLFYDKLIFGKKGLPSTTKDKYTLKSTPLISIIVPIYNVEKYLPSCLDSIIHQTYQNIEIILIDDGSTDNSNKIAKEYAKQDTRIKLFHQKNAGLSATRNVGIKKSTGNYLTFVDPDDEISIEMIKTMFYYLQDKNADIVACSFQEKYQNGKRTHFNKGYPIKSFNTKNALKAMLKEEGFMLSATMKLFPKSFFKNIEFPINKLHEDIGTTYKLIMQAKKITFIPDEFYIYRHHNDSIVYKGFDSRKLDIITLTDQMCDNINEKYPDLKNVTNERRIRARFSILRQIPLNNPEIKNILGYLKTHKSFITDNPEATKTDKLALKIALINPKLFQLAYKVFK